MRQIRFLSALTGSKSKSFPLKVFALLFSVGIVAALLFIPKPAWAVPVLTFGIISAATSLVSGILISFLGLILNILGAIINWLIDPAIWGTGAFTENPTIINAWRIMRDFANLGLVLAIVVIAIGFILRLQTYGSQKTLVRLIAAAILVNFSLVIAGVFIETSTIISRFLMEGFQLRDTWGSLIRASGVMNLFTPSEEVPAWSRAVGFAVRALLPADIAAAANIATNALITAVFAIMMVAVLGALIIMLLIRVAYLWVLLILSPIAWLMWIFPRFESNWNRWWEEFLRWTFFAPIVIFFLALSLTIVGSPAEVGGAPPRPNDPIQAAERVLGQVFHGVIAGSAEPINATIARFAISIALLVLSMIIANQMSITFASQGVQWASAVGKWPGLTAWRAGVKESKGRFATSPLGKSLEERFARSRIPGVGKWADTLRATRTNVEDEAKKVAERQNILTTQQIREDLEDPQKRALMSQAELLGRAIKINERGERLPASVANAILEIAHNTNPKLAESFLPINPQLVREYETNIARRPTPRTHADYARRITTEQAENFKWSSFDAIVDLARRQQAQALFASGMQPSTLAHMLEKNYEAGEQLLDILRDTNNLQLQLTAAGQSQQQVQQALSRVNRMLASPSLAYWV
jgi:hypothetical protein